MERALRNPRFLERVYGAQERAELMKKTGRRRVQSAAAAFSAKEAFAKAMGTGVRGFRLGEVQLLHDGQGAPYLRLSGGAERLCGGRRLSVSVTHTARYAAAVVAAYDYRDGTDSIGF